MHYRYFDFFCGGGMAGVGLGAHWSCAFANDFDPKKGAAYAENHDPAPLRVADVARLATGDLPGQADLAWASFPCQDLSLAGGGAGLDGARSGVFWAFWRLMRGLAAENRAPAVIALENVCGLLTARGGRDFAAVVEAIAGLGYRVGALVVDAERFVPQSRPRLFIIAARRLGARRPVSNAPPDDALGPSAALVRAVATLGPEARENWVWWAPPTPPRRILTLADLVERRAARWAEPDETRRLVELMNARHREKLADVRRSGRRAVGAVFRRMRPDGRGGRAQRAEARFDGVAGCLRTPAGGSSRQILLEVTRRHVRSRLMTPREAARLMGLPESYRPPAAINDALKLFGDGVAAPVVAHLARHVIEPILQGEF